MNVSTLIEIRLSAEDRRLTGGWAVIAIIESLLPRPPAKGFFLRRRRHVNASRHVLNARQAPNFMTYKLLANAGLGPCAIHA